MGNTLFKINTNEIKNDSINNLAFELLYATKSKFENDWHSIMHSHPFTEIFYITKGSGAFVIKNQIKKVSANDLVIIDMLVEHTEVSDEEDPLEYIALGINGLYFVLENLESIEEEGCFIFNASKYKNEIFQYINSIMKETTEKKDLCDEICQSLTTLLVLNLKRILKNKINFTKPTEKINNYLFVKKYLDINYHEEIDLDTLARYAHSNKFYLVRMFKKEYGITPIQYLIEKRIDISKTLLKSTNHSIGQISDIVGFNSQSYFNQTFIKIEKMTPSEYRKKYIKI